jgi:hypothetical protein
MDGLLRAAPIQIQQQILRFAQDDSMRHDAFGRHPLIKKFIGALRNGNTSISDRPRAD